MQSSVISVFFVAYFKISIVRLSIKGGYRGSVGSIVLPTVENNCQLHIHEKPLAVNLIENK